MWRATRVMAVNNFRSFFSVGVMVELVDFVVLISRREYCYSFHNFIINLIFPVERYHEVSLKPISSTVELPDALSLPLSEPVIDDQDLDDVIQTAPDTEG